MNELVVVLGIILGVIVGVLMIIGVGSSIKNNNRKKRKTCNPGYGCQHARNPYRKTA